MADSEGGDIAGGAASGAATGAAIGSYLPGAGTLIGLGAGALIGGFEGDAKYKKLKKAQEAAAAAQAAAEKQDAASQVPNDNLLSMLSELSKNNLTKQKETSFSSFKSLSDTIKQRAYSGQVQQTAEDTTDQQKANPNETLISYLKVLQSGGASQSSGTLGTPQLDYS